MPLLLITLLMFWLQRRVLGRRGYTTVRRQKGGERRVHQARGPGASSCSGYALFVCALAVFLPMLVLTQAAFRARPGGAAFSLDNLTAQTIFHYNPCSRQTAGAERDRQYLCVFRNYPPSPPSRLPRSANLPMW